MTPTSMSSESHGILHNVQTCNNDLPMLVHSCINNLPSSSQVKGFKKIQATTERQDPRETEVAPTAAPPLSHPPPLLEPLGAVDLDFDLPLSPLAPGLTDSEIGDTDSIVSSLFDKAEEPGPEIQEIPATVGAPPDDADTP